MTQSANTLVQGQERALMTLPADLLEAFPSLRSTDIIQRKLKDALGEEKLKYKQDPRRLIRKYQAHVEKMLRLDKEMTRIKKEYDRLRGKVMEVWVTKGLSEIGGATVVPQMSISIAHLEALEQLPRAMRRKVQVLVLDPENFLRLAEEAGIPLGILERNITAKVARVNVMLPKKRKGRPESDGSDADTLAPPSKSERRPQTETTSHA